MYLFLFFLKRFYVLHQFIDLLQQVPDVGLLPFTPFTIGIMNAEHCKL